MNAANLYDDTDPGFLLSPTDQPGIKAFLSRKWYTGGGDTIWAYQSELSFQHTWPLQENLVYSNPTLLTAGMSGFPLGDLYHWFPEEYARWQMQRESENTRISRWLETGSDPGGLSVEKPSDTSVPSKFKLEQNYPNPFNPITRINYSVPYSGFISLKVYNLLGEEVATVFEGVRTVGDYEATFDARALASGVYLYRLQAEDFSISRKLVLLK